MDSEEKNNWRKMWAAFAVGILLAAPVFYILGSSVQSSNCQKRLADLQEKYNLTSKALETQIAQNGEMAARLQYLESSVKTLSKALETISTQLSKVQNSGSADGIYVTTAAVHLVKPDFCIDVSLKNEDARQKIITINIRGTGITGNPQKVGVYAKGEKVVSVCGTLNEAAATGTITINGTPATTTVLVMD